MAFITLDRKKLKKNYDYLDKLFKKKNIQWTVVSKMLCGNKLFLSELLALGVKQISDSRVTNLKVIKSIDPDIETIYIKPPAKRAISSVVKYADISMNTELDTIRLLANEAERQGKIHKVIIVIELGELREGIVADEFLDFFEQVFTMQHIEVVGIGANLACMYGVLPNHDKLIQLSLYEQLIEARFNKHIPYVSGGSSVTIPLIFQRLLPAGINHFRVGETLFLGTDVYHNNTLKHMQSDVFRLFTEIIEINEKPTVPYGDMGTNVEGETYDIDKEKLGETTHRAIIDLGLLDTDREHIDPIDSSVKFLGASSDMLVVDLGDNSRNYKVGDLIEFRMDYMGTLKAINSKYIDKRVV